MVLAVRGSESASAARGQPAPVRGRQPNDGTPILPPGIRKQMPPEISQPRRLRPHPLSAAAQATMDGTEQAGGGT